MITAIAVIGICAIVAMVGFVVLGALRGWSTPPAPLLLKVAAVLGIACAVLGFIHSMN